jgi:hypothetical protein
MIVAAAHSQQRADFAIAFRMANNGHCLNRPGEFDIGDGIAGVVGQHVSLRTSCTGDLAGPNTGGLRRKPNA